MGILTSLILVRNSQRNKFSSDIYTIWVWYECCFRLGISREELENHISKDLYEYFTDPTSSFIGWKLNKP